MKQYTPIFLFLLSVIPCYSQERFIQIDSTKIRVNTIGMEDRKEGQPVIVFESGYGTPMGNWDRVISDSASLSPMVTYDRPGVGASEPVDEMPTLKNVADRLVRILDHLEIAPPYLMVGHSLGGVYVRGFAIHHPEKLAGLVIVDPGDFTETRHNKRDYYKFMGWSEERIDQELAELDRKDRQRDKDIPAALQRERLVLRNLRQRDFREIMESPLPNIPVHILVGGRFDMPKHMHSKDYDSEALFRSKMKHRVARWTEVIQSVDRGMLMYSGDAGHFVHWDDPELAIASIGIALKDYHEMTSRKKSSSK